MIENAVLFQFLFFSVYEVAFPFPVPFTDSLCSFKECALQKFFSKIESSLMFFPEVHPSDLKARKTHQIREGNWKGTGKGNWKNTAFRNIFNHAWERELDKHGIFNHHTRERELEKHSIFNQTRERELEKQGIFNQPRERELEKHSIWEDLCDTAR